jgi:hypothetical protein
MGDKNVKNLKTCNEQQKPSSRIWIPAIAVIFLFSWALTSSAKPQVSWIQESWVCESIDGEPAINMKLRLWYPESKVVILQWLVSECTQDSCLDASASDAVFLPLVVRATQLSDTKISPSEVWPPLMTGAALVGDFTDFVQRRLTLVEVEAAKYPSWFSASYQSGEGDEPSIEMSCSR